MTSVVHLGIQGSYKSFEIALFEGGDYVDLFVGDKVQASSNFVLSIEQLLKRNGKNISDVAFIAVDQGPGAFTSLRVIISTINGLAFDTNIKLIGIDGLDALAQQALDNINKRDNKDYLLVSLLNAYNHEVYYGVYDINGGELAPRGPKGYKKVDVFLRELKELCDHNNKDCIFVGNGAELHKDLITWEIMDLSVCSAKQVGEMGFNKWEKKVGVCSELKPLYLKSQTFAVRS